MGFSPSFDGGSAKVGGSRKVVSSEPPRRRFEFGVIGCFMTLLALNVGSDPVDVDRLGQKLRRPNTTPNSPQPDFLSGEVSAVSAIVLQASLLIVQFMTPGEDGTFSN